MKKTINRWILPVLVVLVIALISIYTNFFIKEEYSLTTSDFYSLSDSISSYNISKDFEFDNSILDYSSKIAYIIKDKPVDLNKYYYVDIEGNTTNEEQNRVIVQFITYSDNAVVEKFNLGIDSNYNIIKLSEDYDTVKLNLLVYGSSDIVIESVDIFEVEEFRYLDSDKFEINSRNIKNFDNVILNVMYDDFSVPTDEVLTKLDDDVFVMESERSIFYYTVEDMLDYENSEIKDRTNQLLMSEFSSAIPYVKLSKSRDDVLLKYYELIESFIDTKHYISIEDGLLYNDLAVAGRVHTWLYYYGYAKTYLDKAQRDKLLMAIVYQANLLVESQFNTKATNHGLYQDVIYLEFLNVLCNKYDVEKELDSVIRSINCYFEGRISEDGVHSEHSPSYQILMTDVINRVVNVYDKSNIDSRKLSDIEYKMNEYLAYITKPDGYLPEIGDTEYKQNDYWDAYDFKLDKFKVYDDEGYAVYKNDKTYVLFYNAYKSYYHKHSDENDLWIYRDGDIIREAGKNGYNYNDPYTKYAYSSWGHNTLIVNDKGLVEEKNIPNDYNYEGTYIESYDLDNRSIVGVTTRYEGVTWKRNVNIDEENDAIISSDVVSSDDKNKYTFLWNLDASIQAVRDGDAIKLYRDKELVMTISFDSDETYNVQLIKGTNKPRIIGYQVSDGEMVKTTTIRVDINNSSKVEFKTKFQFNK